MANRANSKTKPADTAVAVSGSMAPGLPGQHPLTEADVARRAYDLYLARGREPGRDVEDWLQAERDLRGASIPPRRIRKGRHDARLTRA